MAFRSKKEKLLKAIEHGDERTVEGFLVKNPDLANAFLDKNETTALILASTLGDNNIVRLLLSRGANVNLQDVTGTTPLMWASQNGRFNVVETLLSAGADANHQSIEKGTTALMLASGQSIVQALLSHNAYVDAQDDDGTTALMRAAWEGNTAIVETLLSNKPNINLKDNGGHTALTRASERGFHDIVQLFQCHQQNQMQRQQQDSQKQLLEKQAQQQQQTQRQHEENLQQHQKQLREHEEQQRKHQEQQQQHLEQQKKQQQQQYQQQQSRDQHYQQQQQQRQYDRQQGYGQQSQGYNSPQYRAGGGDYQRPDYQRQSSGSYGSPSRDSPQRSDGSYGSPQLRAGGYQRPDYNSQRQGDFQRSDSYGSPQHRAGGNYQRPDYQRQGSNNRPDYQRQGDFQRSDSYGSPQFRGSGYDQGYQRPDYQRQGSGNERPDYQRQGRNERPDYQRQGSGNERPDYQRQGSGNERADYQRQGGYERRDYQRPGSSERPDYQRQGSGNERGDYQRQQGSNERLDYQRQGSYDRQGYQRQGSGSNERLDYQRPGSSERSDYQRQGGYDRSPPQSAQGYDSSQQRARGYERPDQNPQRPEQQEEEPQRSVQKPFEAERSTPKTASSSNEVQTLLSDQWKELSWPMELTGAPTKWKMNGLYDVVGTSLNLPVFKKRNAEFYMYCAPEKKWVISRTQDGNTTTALFQSEETCEEKQMPSSVSVWKGLQQGEWVVFQEVSVRDYVSFRQVFANCDLSDKRLQKLQNISGVFESGSNMCGNLQNIIQLMPKGVVHLASIFEICAGFAAFIEPLSQAFCFAEAAIGIIGKIAQMAYAAVMNQRKCVLLMKRLESVQPTVNQLSNNMKQGLSDMLDLRPLPSSKDIAHKKQDMTSLLPALTELVESMEECKRVIYQWKGWKEGKENKKDKRKALKYAKRVATGLRQGLTAETMKDEFIDSGLRLDRALQTLNVALSNRMFMKMEQLMKIGGSDKWKEEVEREDVVDEKRLGGDVSKLMNENEEFKIEMEVMYQEIGAQITRNHASLQEVLSDEFGKIHARLDSVDSQLKLLLLQTQQQQQPQQQFHSIPWDELSLKDPEDIAPSGAYGVVYEGKWGTRHVAVKMMNIGKVGRKVLNDLKSEAETHCTLRHPNIILFHGLVEEKHALVMEWAAPDLLFFLEDWVEPQPIPWSQKWTMALQIAKGMKFVHTKNLLHHDLRAANVLIGSPQGSRLCRLCDFGLARWKHESSKVSTQQSGNPHWWAPEYCEGGGYTNMCDVFSFGVTLYEIVADGELPFKNRSDVKDLYIKGLRNQQLEGLKDVPEAFKEMIKLCWHQNHIKRPTFEQIVMMITSEKYADAEITV